MRIALSVWNGRIAPLFDVACNIQVIDTEDDNRFEVTLPLQSGMIRRVEILASQPVDVLICGAVSRAVHRMLSSSGIDVRSFVSGEIEEILKAFLAGELDDLAFRMPGCGGMQGGRGCGRGAGVNRRGRGRGSCNGKKEV